MTKYRKYFLEMMEKNEWLFGEFKKVHDNYSRDPFKYQVEFNRLGKAVVEEIREWERKLCRHSERGQFGVFSSNLADKFWKEVRIYFPKIDYVGVKLSESK